ncbi:Transposon Ty3-G Gag-Pol poly, partial [Paramuricea clavata]
MASPLHKVRNIKDEKKFAEAWTETEDAAFQNIKEKIADATLLNCQACQTAKVGRHTKAATVQVPLPTRRFGDINVDIVGPLNPPCKGKNMLFTIIDKWTGYVWASPMSEQGGGASASKCAKHLLQWCSLFGVPTSITSDRGSQFTSKLWEETTQTLGIEHKITTAYHPEHNGRVERFHRSLKNSLRARLNGRSDWLGELPWALLGIRNMPNSDTGVSPAELVFGERLRTPGDLTPIPTTTTLSAWASAIKAAVSAQKPNSPLWHQDKKPYVPLELEKCSQIWLRQDRIQPSLKPKYSGPYNVIERNGKVFKILVEAECEEHSKTFIGVKHKQTTSTMSSLRLLTRQQSFDAIVVELSDTINSTKSFIEAGRIRPGMGADRSASIKEIFTRLRQAKEKLLDAITTNDDKVELHDEEIAKNTKLFLDLEIDLGDADAEIRQEPTTEPKSKTKPNKKIFIREFDEQFPDVWFDQLEIQLEEAEIFDDAGRFAVLQRFVDSRQSLAIAPALKGEKGQRYQSAKKTLLSIYLPRTPAKIAAIWSTRLGEGETAADLRAQIEPRAVDLNIQDIIKYIIYREMPSRIQTQLTA